jgi:hypothetical protein
MYICIMYVCMSVCMCVCICVYVCMYIATDIQATEILHISKLWMLSVCLENFVSTKHFVIHMNGVSFCLLTVMFNESFLSF